MTVIKWFGGLVLLFLLVLVVLAFIYKMLYTREYKPSTCLANMNQLSKAILSYCSEYDDYFPCTRAPGVANGTQPERGIEARKGPVPFGGMTWVERIDSYVQKGGIEDGPKGIMKGALNCPEREKQWSSAGGQDGPDWHSYGYNFLYLGLPWRGDRSPKTNPYRAWGFTNGVQRVSRLENTADTILLVESRSIWAFPPYSNKGRVLGINRTCISPRHNHMVNVAFCDGHAKSMDGRELVTKGRMTKDGQIGAASSNRLWGVVNAGKHPMGDR